MNAIGVISAFRDSEKNDEPPECMTLLLLDSRQLLAFSTLARLQSFTRSAKALSLTQSAISHAIKALEDDVGTRLFDRIGKRALLTHAGEALLGHSERILREMHDARAKLEELQDWGQSRLRLGASPTACQYLLPTVLREFKQSFPSCQIKIEAGEAPQLCELLLSNHLDLALTLDPRNHDVAFRTLFTDELMLLVSPLHPWVQRQAITPESFSRETFIVYSRTGTTYRMVEEYLHAEGGDLTHVMELGNLEAIKELCKVGVGVGVMAAWVAEKELKEGSLIALPLGQRTLKRAWGIASLRERRFTLVEETFAGLAESVAEIRGLEVGRGDATMSPDEHSQKTASSTVEAGG